MLENGNLVCVRKSMIDVHNVRTPMVSFILQYLFLHSEEPQYKDVFGNKQKKSISILCGKGTHSTGRNSDDGDHTPGMPRLMKYISDELNCAWHPNIRCSRAKDGAILHVNKRDVEFWIAANEHKLL